MKVIVPNELKLGIRRFKVYTSSHIQGDEGKTGTCNFRTEEIFLQNSLSNSIKLITLLHEYIHVIDCAYGCDLNEQNTDRMAHGIAELLENFGLEFDWCKIKER